MTHHRLATFCGILLLLASAMCAAGEAHRAASPFDAAFMRASTIDFTPHASQPGLIAPLAPSNYCRFCHAANGGTEQEFMPFDTWSGTMMANAARDPLLWAALDIANHDAPGVGDFCLRCHAPRAWFSGRVHKNGSGGFVTGQDGCLMRGDHDDQDDSDLNDFDGVGCQTCHRLMPGGPNEEFAPHGSGNIWLDGASSLSCSDFGDVCMRGPYAYGPQRPDIYPPPHPWKTSSLHRDAAICGSCHDVTSPILAGGALRTLKRADGSDTGVPFPLERTFREWQYSAYADRIFADSYSAADEARGGPHADQPCQDCHMRTSTDAQAHACNQNVSGSRAGELPVHEFAGANAWMPRVLSAIYGGPSGLDREAAFERSAVLAEQLLSTQAASVSLSAPGTAAGTVTARIRVTNLSGHKLPTGYGEGRRMWLDVQLRDDVGTLLWESGAYNAATGTLGTDPQLHVYEVQQGVWSAGSASCEVADGGGRALFHFVTSDCIRKDNRIPPLGFRGIVDLETQPVAYAYPQTAPGSGVLVNYDEVDYVIPLPASGGPMHITATLRHQVATREYVEFLRDEAVSGSYPNEDTLCGPARAPLATGPRQKTRGAFMYDLWTQQGRSPPATLGTASATVSLN